jgi:hypothetical protein
MGSGDENGAGMTALLANAEALSQHFGCLVLFVHHVGLGEEAQKRPRGHSSLGGALADHELALQKAGGSIMNSPQTKSDNDFNARLRQAYFDLESDVHDLSHMASIAWTLFDDTIKAPDSGTGLHTVQMTKDEFESLEFAVSKTMNMASDLRETYLRAIEQAKKTQ